MSELLNCAKTRARSKIWNTLDTTTSNVAQLNSGLFDPAGSDTMWSDYLAPMSTAKLPAANYPTWAAFGPSGNIYAYKFIEDDFIFLAGFHINHDIKVGSKMYPHVHWASSGTSTETVEWELEYTIAKGHNQEAFPAPSTVTISEAASSTPWQHQISEVSLANAIDAPEVDSLVLMRLKRTTTGNNTDDVFGLFVDLHVEIDRVGTKNKAPNFYT
jgi:hypothetical protein